MKLITLCSLLTLGCFAVHGFAKEQRVQEIDSALATLQPEYDRLDALMAEGESYNGRLIREQDKLGQSIMRLLDERKNLVRDGATFVGE